MHIDKKTLRYIFFGAITCILLYWILHEPARVNAVWATVKGVFAPFVMGATIAFILNVPMRGFENLLRKVKNASLRRLIAVCLTLVCVLLVLALICLLLIPQLIDTINSLVPTLRDFVTELEAFVLDFFQNKQTFISWNDINAELAKLDWGSLLQQAFDLIRNSLTVIVSSALTAIGSVVSAMVDVLIAVVFALYCLFQKENLARQGRKLLYAFLPENTADYIVRIMRLANSTFSNFLSGQCVEVCILGTMFAISMAIFRMPYIPLISVLVAITAFIPVVGAWVGCVLGAFFIFVSNPLQAVWFVIMFLILQQIENNMIYPRVVGTSIGLSGMWVLLAVAVGGELMGVAGMFLMIPAASVIYALLREITAQRLVDNEIDPDKLRAHPPEIQSKFKEKQMHRKKKRELKKAAKSANKSNNESIE